MLCCAVLRCGVQHGSTHCSTAQACPHSLSSGCSWRSSLSQLTMACRGPRPEPKRIKPNRHSHIDAAQSMLLAPVFHFLNHTSVPLSSTATRQFYLAMSFRSTATQLSLSAPQQPLSSTAQCPSAPQPQPAHLNVQPVVGPGHGGAQAQARPHFRAAPHVVPHRRPHALALRAAYRRDSMSGQAQQNVGSAPAVCRVSLSN